MNSNKNLQWGIEDQKKPNADCKGRFNSTIVSLSPGDIAALIVDELKRSLIESSSLLIFK